MNILRQRTPEDPTLVQGLVDSAQLLGSYAASRAGDMLGTLSGRFQKPLAVFAGAATIGGALAGAEALAAPQPPGFSANYLQGAGYYAFSPDVDPATGLREVLYTKGDPAAIKAHNALVKRCEERSRFVTHLTIGSTTFRTRNRLGSAELTGIVTSADGSVRIERLPTGSLRPGETLRGKLTWKYKNPKVTTLCGLEVTTGGRKIYFPKPDRKTRIGGEFVDSALLSSHGQPNDPFGEHALNFTVYFRPKKK